MKKGLDPFRALKLLDTQEQVESVAVDDAALYLGMSTGALIQYDCNWSGGTASIDDVAASMKRRAGIKLSQKQPVERLYVSGGFVFALADGTLTVLSRDIQAAGAQVLSREVKNFCMHTGLDAQQMQSGPPQPEVCVSLRKRIVLYGHKGKGAFEQRQEFPTSEPALALVWHQTWICVGFRREYSLYSDRAGVPREICHLDGKFTPQIVIAPGNELVLMIQDSVGLFYNLSMQQPSPRNPVTWPRRVAGLGAAGNYIFGGVGGGQVDVFGVRDQKNCQSLTLDGAAVSTAPAPGNRALVACQGGAVVILDPVPFKRQVQMLLMQVRVTDAIDLLNASFSPEDPRRVEQLGKLQHLAGWALFNDLQFAKAFAHFVYAPNFSVARPLAFWRARLPGGANHPAISGVGRTADASDVTDAPDPKDIHEFIREKIQDKLEKKIDNPTDTVEGLMAAADAAMATFLLKMREALIALASTDYGQLLAAVDTVLLKLLVESPDVEQREQRLQRLLDGGLRCTVADCEKFLREKARQDILAKLWKVQGMYDLVLEQYGAVLSGGDSSKCAKIVPDIVDTLRRAATASGSADLLRKYVPKLLSVDPLAVLKIFVGSVTETQALSADEVLKLLESNKDALLGYLEHLVLGRRVSELQYPTRLGLIYLAQVAEERKTGNPGACREKALRFFETTESLDGRSLMPKAVELGLHEERVVLCCREQDHQEALRILVETLNDLPRAEIYCRVIMARAALCGAAARDGSRVDVSVFCSPPPAWASPEVFQIRRGAGGDDDGEHPQGAAGSGGGTAVEVDANQEHENAVCSAALRRVAKGLVSSGSKPLMLLFRVLLNALMGSEKDAKAYPKVKAEYGDAVMALITTYAGHSDLPPYEVVAMLPADWSLDFTATYLTKATRICLHEGRAGKLEENLSSMAYLKTFDALAHERSAKVTITADRCCPVCIRRFVDKDSVGKAFVAYPNLTCVHLQCKDDLSVCPKTGQNFADNLSVFCNALGVDSSD
eukprot:TRINITY_DN20155_c0_g1_i2.p1 TRINITY_DN20155_c0_g1~~TRINITY_DN20155_c0_g1_i2.p1  ORF type:complete len:1007 (+),score=218.04 TRINITY_DN20155_c0_g1_i2:199-3219(+)